MEFKLGQLVLCRDEADEDWDPHHFAKIIGGDEPYLVFGGWKFRQCIPLEGNESLIGASGGPEPEKPEIAHYEFLERVETFDRDKDAWRPAVYIQGHDESRFPHQVVFADGSKYTGWFRDSEVRRAVSNG